MAHGLEKLEQLFTGSRRRARGRQRSTQMHPKASILTDRRPSSPMFPSPSYLRPTSMHMTPRDAQIDGPEGNMSRFQSVPTLQEALDKRSSLASSITVVNRSSRSDTSVSSLRRSNKISPTKPRSSRFRFPEDSLFKNQRPISSSGCCGKNNTLREESPHTRNAETGLLDWTPTHVSLLFNPLEFKASSSNNRESTLLPSPDFTPSTSSPESDKSLDNPGQQTVPRPSLLPRGSVHKLTSNLRQQSLSSRGKSLTECVPAFSADEASQKPIINRSMSLNGLTRVRPNTTHGALTVLSTSGNTSNFKGRRSVRETWGSRRGDPHFRSSLRSTGEDAPCSKLRRSASTSTLSISTSQTSKCSVLKEPTFDDFYALSDDDIAECQPFTSSVRVPPTPPRKEIRNSYRKSRLSQTPISRPTTFKPVREEITPPSTPTNCHLLALTYSPTNPRDTLGALRAAELARKYDFAVLYVLSLWPVDGDRCLDISTTTVTSRHQATNATVTEGFVASRAVTNVSGRLLAAYGLNEVPSPFEIVTDTHLAALNCDYWNEYRNLDARPDDISRGWIRPFYSEYTPVFASSRAAGGHHPKNRGIVFAAYSKQTFNPVIPMRNSAKQALLLRQLYSDAKALVEALVEPPSKSRKAPVSRRGL